MKRNDVLNMAFSLLRMKKDYKYNPKKYNYLVPNSLKKQKLLFDKINSFEIEHLTQYSNNNVLIRLVINYWVNNNNNIKKVSEEDYHYFINNITKYKDEFKIFVSNSNYDLTPQKLYIMYVNKEISFYVFYYVLKHNKFENSFVSNYIIKNKILEIKGLFKIFNHFDEDWIKNELLELNKIISLGSVS